MRIHVWLAKYTDLSRRAAEKKVGEGLVKINGKTAEIGQMLSGDETVSLEGKVIRGHTLETKLIALNKPEGYECSRRPQGKGVSVYELLPVLKTGKWILIGRLDVNTSGLLLVTNDGALSHRLAHPSNGYEREYLVRINGALTQDEINRLKKGIQLEDGMAKCKTVQPHRPTQGINAWYKLTLTEGRNRIVRRLMKALGREVSRLIRVRFGPIKLEKALGSGSHQEIDVRIFK